MLEGQQLLRTGNSCSLNHRSVDLKTLWKIAVYAGSFHIALDKVKL